MEEKSLLQKCNSKIRNNPISVIAIITCSFVISLAAFTESAQKLFELFQKDTIKRPFITGEWASSYLNDTQRRGGKYKLFINLSQQGKQINGYVRTISETGADYSSKIMDAVYNGDSIYFRIEEPILFKGETVNYSFFFNGKLQEKGIYFDLTSDLPGYYSKRFLTKRD